MIPMSDVAINKQNKLRELRHEMIQVSNLTTKRIIFIIPLNLRVTFMSHETKATIFGIRIMVLWCYITSTNLRLDTEHISSYKKSD